MRSHRTKDVMRAVKPALHQYQLAQIQTHKPNRKYLPNGIMYIT